MSNKQTISLNKPIDHPTQLQQIRIELIKIIYRHDRSPEELCEKAKLFEPYVNGSTAK